MFIKLFLGYFNFFYFQILPRTRRLLFAFLRVRFFVIPFKKNNESLIILYTTGAYSHGILNIIIPFYLFLILSVAGSKTNYCRFD